MFPSPHQKLLQTWEQMQKTGNSPGRELVPPATSERNSSTCVSGPASQRRWVNYSIETQENVGKAPNTWDRVTQVYAEQRTKRLSQGQRRKEAGMWQDVFSKISWSFRGPISEASWPVSSRNSSVSILALGFQKHHTCLLSGCFARQALY